MKVCILGPGAIGSHIAARFARGGQAEVSVLARGAQLEAIRARGITVRTPEEAFTAHPRAEADAAALGPQDAVVVTVKAPAVPGIAAAIGPLLRPDTPVVFVLNGIPWWWEDAPEVLDPGRATRATVGLERAVGGVVWSACTVTEPGVVQVQTAANRLIMGELSGEATPRLKALAAALEAGGMGGVVSPAIRTEIWTKLLNNLTNGPITLITRQDMRTTYSDPVVMAAARAVMQEGMAIAAALGHPLGADIEKNVLRSVTLAHRPSILQDFEAGRALEFDALLEVPLQLARAAGVSAPTLELLVALARKTVGRG
ncbi:MAG TPA: 2-dehydropantoate 2-reductase [Roseococcus sp.]|jgi:2-dehydropantoate 2-reductase|nr:2-dehydropantoate 2-reductase [Roseococcus sp.]